MNDNPFAPIGGVTSGKSGASSSKTKWVTVVPVPADAPPAPTIHPKLGRPTARWSYTDAAGRPIGFVLRFDAASKKEFRPLTYCRPEGGGAAAWRWESWQGKRPLYGLQELAERPGAPVVVTEGEKACDAARVLLPASVVVTSPNGATNARHADWRPLKGCSITIWPDADSAGNEYANEVVGRALAAGATSVRIAVPPRGVKTDWDAADALAEGWDETRAAAFIASATEKKSDAGRGEGREGGDGERKRVPQRDILIGCTEFVQLWHDANRIAYATYPVNGHLENWPIRSRDFRMWLSGRYYEETGGAIGGQALEDGIRILEARAVNNGPLFECFIRVGHQAGKLYLDLCHDDWRAIEITGTTWAVVEKPTVKLMRSTAMRALAQPEQGGLIEELRRFVNTSDDEFMMVVAWLVAALRHYGPYPILVLNGEQGAGKSVVSRMLRSLVDPSAAPIRAVPKDDRDLVVSAGNSWVLAFDNLSAVPAWLSDALCRLATGSGFATRMLHTDNAEAIFEAARPIILNGIPSLTDRPDLADRALTIHLKAIPENERRPEDELLAEFDAARPRIISALCDAVSAALRNVDKVKLERSPRMADFVKWTTAAESGLGWEAGEFIAAYNENRRGVSETVFEADSVAVAIRNFVIEDHPLGWEGTPTELLAEINNRVAEGIRKARTWPMTAQALGNRIDRIAPLLRNKGFVVERMRSTVRTIKIIPPPA
ncbi:ATP-binding protein [Bradyrhizobium sp. dw_78]|uniref:ATP-binding protein n=1 Tax=Bradyrhizobium sp. dw_78 TaxID=2719793 RepID=UPI00201BBA19|nr:ATP-binding protein [Bradyrhizobium sp. dw_78]